jgi:hypothetical protein
MRRRRRRKKITEKDFPTLTSNKPVFRPSAVWGKKETNLLEKGKAGFHLINSFPKFSDSPEPPLFQ